MACLLHGRALQAARTGGACARRCLGQYLTQNTAAVPATRLAPTPTPRSFTHAKAFSTTEDPEGDGAREKSREAAVGSIGRKIHERVIRVLDEQGKDLGSMHRADVIRLLNERDLKLVKRSGAAQPPEYQLMTGVQIQEERLRLREMARAKPRAGGAPTKELTFSSNIGQHDLDTKTKQIQQWLEKRHRVQVTIKRAKKANEPENKMEEICQQLLRALPSTAAFASRPQAVRGGSAVMCVLRPLNEEEKEEARRGAPGSQGRDPQSMEHGNTHRDVPRR